MELFRQLARVATVSSFQYNNQKIPQPVTGLIVGLRPANERRSNAVSHWLGANLESALCNEYQYLVWSAHDIYS